MGRIIRFLKTACVLSNEYPKGCCPSADGLWMFKDCCPACLAKPIECLSIAEYERKYPARNVVNIGHERIYLCDYHTKQLAEKFTEWLEQESTQDDRAN